MSGGRAVWRVLGLAVAVNLRSKLKFALLTVLIAISALVFLGVTELSRASTSDLETAIEGDLGIAGTYRVTPAADLGLSRTDLLSTIRTVTDQFADRPIDVALRFPAVRPQCPPFEQLGDVTAVVLIDSQGAAAPFRRGELAPAAGTDLCLEGLVVPQSALRECSEPEKRRYDCSIVISPLYEQLMRLAAPQASGYEIIVTTGRVEDQTTELRNALNQSLESAAATASIDPQNAVIVNRGDSGDSVRSASDGIRLVYALIAWGVLIVGGIGVLVAELIVLRDRTWFFGLARAVGARRWGVAWLVMADILIVLLAGLASAILILIATAPMVSSFGNTAFQENLQILRPSALPSLAAGLMFMLVLGGAYPAWRATQLDPLDVLERR